MYVYIYTYIYILYISLQPPNSQGVTLIVLWLTELAALEGRDLTLGQGSHHRSTGFGVPVETGHHPNAGQVTWQMHMLCFFSNVFSNVLSSHLAHLAQDFSRCIDATWCNILRNLLNRCKKENLAGFQLDASSSCGALCLQRWDLGNYYTVGGSGRVIPKDPVPVSQCLNVSMASDGIRWPHFLTFPGWWPRFSVFQHMHWFLVHLAT